MNIVMRFFVCQLVSVFFLLANAIAQPTDTDGDGVPEHPNLSAGSHHACALDAVGVQCWGRNNEGQLNTPSLNHPKEVSAGGYHTCAIDDDGVHCWGAGKTNTNTHPDFGQSIVPPLVNPVAISAGYYHACALDENGVHCWGNNNEGATTVPILKHPLAISTGGWHSCAMDDDGVHCWGDNSQGQTNVPLLQKPVSVSAGGLFTCALDANGVQCWGNNDFGELQVPALSHPTVISAGYAHACALDDTGVRCWGGMVKLNEFYSLSHPSNVSAGLDYSCVVDDGGVQCTDRYNLPATWVPVLVLDQFPMDQTEWIDTDGDHLGDNGDPLINDAHLLNSVSGSLGNDSSGKSVAFAGDFDGDGYGDYVIGTSGYDVPANDKIKAVTDVGKAVVISGRNGHVLASVQGNLAKDGFGFAVAGNGDVDHDGYADVLVGAPMADDVAKGIKDTGSVTLLYGPDGSRRETFFGPAAKSQFGYAVALGDVYGDDGHADILIGAPTAPYADAGFKAAGSVSLFNGSDLSPEPVMYGADKSLFGASLAVGNVQATGGMSAIVGSPGHTNLDNGARSAGAVFVARYSGAFVNSPVRFGASANMRLGTAVAAGDVDGDGHDEVLAGAPTDSSGGVKQAGSAIIYSSSDFKPMTTLRGTTQKAGFGRSIAVGDINGDGYADILVGAPKDATPALPKKAMDAGSVSVFDGNGFSLLHTLHGEKAKDNFGTAISAGDINSDGKADLIIGIPGTDVPGSKLQRDAGRVMILSGAAL